jgi:type IV pilus assembly protein PilE
MDNRNISRGFTLIEIMVVTAIVAILAMIAYPSYQEYVQRSRRADAQAVLLQAAQWMERYFSQNNRYSDSVNGNANGLFSTSGLTTAGNGANVFYNISLTAVNDTTFTLSAIPAAGGPQVNDKCGNFTINNTGVKNATGILGANQCWRR